MSVGGASEDDKGRSPRKGWKVSLTLSDFAQGLKVESAFDVLAVAKKLKSAGKDVIELQIGDSPFPSTSAAKQAGIDAIRNDESHYCASIGLPEFRQAAADQLNRDYQLQLTADDIVAAPGGKPFEQFFCEAVLNPGDEVLVFTPQFPTYEPNIARRQAVVVQSVLREEDAFRPRLDEVERFVARPRAKAIFLNSPHNPTGGVATKEDVAGIADLVRGKQIGIFSDEPYDRMVWQGKHHTILAEPGMMDQCVAAYTFSKSFSMSGWRLGYAASGPALIAAIGKMINTTLSCVPPMVQRAGQQALEQDIAQRDEYMQRFQKKVDVLTRALAAVDGVAVTMPAGTFYVFPNVTQICNRLQLTSHGLAMFLLEEAQTDQGVACLGGECFGPAGHGYLRLSCAEPDDRLLEAVNFIEKASTKVDAAAAFAQARPQYRLAKPYREPSS